MAIEKLTGPRLYQLIFLLVVLITAFTWRTVTYVPVSDMSLISEDSDVCDITNKACILNLDKNQIIIDVIERPIKQNTEMTVSVAGSDTELKIEAEGIDMNMGILKFIPEKAGNNSQLYSVFLPKCKHNEMRWKMNITLKEKTLNVIFSDKK
ncbi:hypothetical protein [Aliivibrio sp. 1S128]|uniref:hypothetical protein n=1 Tax=Aliivibrio sp. 1S128 TaxID=1840085 RepID=UPI00080E5A90|nr:hypothetical protein [Aliivibrio sp. 1S128]OCH19737.1 hypothetical protein A6E03_10440 [Aliivibrio sp. 1S128]